VHQAGEAGTDHRHAEAAGYQQMLTVALAHGAGVLEKQPIDHAILHLIPMATS
jgi:hypothetical protein